MDNPCSWGTLEQQTVASLTLAYPHDVERHRLRCVAVVVLVAWPTVPAIVLCFTCTRCLCPPARRCQGRTISLGQALT